MNKTTNVEKETTASVEATTPKRATTSAKAEKVKTIDDVKISDRVSIDNLFSWNICFQSSESNRGIIISPDVKDFKQLTVAEVDSQVKLHNVAFCGTDGFGAHAAFRIKDPLIREYVFGADTNPIQLTEDSVRDLLNTKNRNEFTRKLEELVVTRSEKKMIISVAKRIGVDDVESYKTAAIENISGSRF